jgi:hypothetical protein
MKVAVRLKMQSRGYTVKGKGCGCVRDEKERY